MREKNRRLRLFSTENSSLYSTPHDSSEKREKSSMVPDDDDFQTQESCRMETGKKRKIRTQICVSNSFFEKRTEGVERGAYVNASAR